MYIERKQDLSVYYYISNLFTDEGATFVNVVTEFPTENLKIPTVSIENGLFTVPAFELGNKRGMDMRFWHINIFANNNSQKDDYSYLIKNSIQDGIPVFDYDEGFPPDVSPTQIGALVITDLQVNPIRVMSELVTTMYYRAEVKFLAYYTP